MFGSWRETQQSLSRGAWEEWEGKGERRLGRPLRVKQWRVLVPNQDTFILQWELSRICGQRRENFRVGVSLELFYLGHLRSVHLHTLSLFP